MDESLWPARNVAEYAYCPRLFYFMEVEGIFHYRPKSWGERMPLALLRLLTGQERRSRQCPRPPAV